MNTTAANKDIVDVAAMMTTWTVIARVVTTGMVHGFHLRDGGQECCQEHDDRRRIADSVACPKTELERLTERVGYEMK